MATVKEASLVKIVEQAMNKWLEEELERIYRKKISHFWEEIEEEMQRRKVEMITNSILMISKTMSFKDKGESVEIRVTKKL